MPKHAWTYDNQCSEDQNKLMLISAKHGIGTLFSSVCWTTFRSGSFRVQAYHQWPGEDAQTLNGNWESSSNLASGCHGWRWGRSLGCTGLRMWLTYPLKLKTVCTSTWTKFRIMMMGLMHPLPLYLSHCLAGFHLWKKKQTQCKSPKTTSPQSTRLTRPQVPTKCERWPCKTVWPCSWPHTPAVAVLLNLWKKSLNHFILESALCTSGSLEWKSGRLRYQIRSVVPSKRIPPFWKLCLSRLGDHRRWQRKLLWWSFKLVSCVDKTAICECIRSSSLKGWII